MLKLETSIWLQLGCRRSFISDFQECFNSVSQVGREGGGGAEGVRRVGGGGEGDGEADIIGEDKGTMFNELELKRFNGILEG